MATQQDNTANNTANTAATKDDAKAKPAAGPFATASTVAPPATNPPSPTDGSRLPMPDPAATVKGERAATFRIKNNMPRPVTLGGVLLVPGAETDVPDDEDGVNKRDADMEGLEIVTADSKKRTDRSARETERMEQNALEVGDVLHPVNGPAPAVATGGIGPTLAKPPEEIVADAKASGWKPPKA